MSTRPVLGFSMDSSKNQLKTDNLHCKRIGIGDIKDGHRHNDYKKSVTSAQE